MEGFGKNAVKIPYMCLPSIETARLSEPEEYNPTKNIYQYRLWWSKTNSFNVMDQGTILQHKMVTYKNSFCIKMTSSSTPSHTHRGAK